MICPKCKSLVEDDSMFCNVCGAQVTNSQQQSQPVQSQTEVMQDSQNVAFDQNVANNQSNTYNQGYQGAPYGGNFMEQTPKKSRKGLKIAIPVIAAIAVVGVVAAANASKIKNFVSKTFQSPTEYYKSVEMESIDKASEGFEQSYGMIVGAFDDLDSKSCSVDVGFELGSMAKQYINMAAASSGYDLSWLDNGKIGLTINSDEGTYGINGKASINDTDIVSCDVVYSADESKVYMAVPEVCGKYFSTVAETEVDMNYVTQLIKSCADALPDSDVVGNIIARYGKTIIDSIDNVEEESAVLEANGVSQDCTAYSMVIDTETAKKMLKAIVEELGKDDDIKKIMCENYDALVNVFANSNLPGMAEGDVSIPAVSGKDMYDQMMAALEGAKTAIDSLDMGQETLNMTVYVNNKGEVCGRFIKCSAFDIDYRFPMDGDKFGMLFAMNENVQNTGMSMTGSGTYANEVMSGDFVINTGDAQMPEIGCYIKDYDLKDAENGYASGTIGYEFGPLLTQAGVPGFDNAVFEYSFETKKDEMGLVFSAKSNAEDEEPLVAVSLDTAVTDAEKVSIPDAGNVVDIQDMEAVGSVMSEINLDKVISSLEAAKVDNSILDIIKQYSQMITMGASY